MMGWEPPAQKNGLWAKLNRVLLGKIHGSASPGERIFIVVDDDFWEEVSPELKIQAHDIKEYVVAMLRDDWDIAFRVDAELQAPMIFPLIAIQLYAAFRMRKEGAFGHNAYNPRLLEIFRKKGQVNWLSKQYEAYQEEAWQAAQEILERFDYQFPIPMPKHGAGRYTQYPRLHTLLNQQDLNSISHYLYRAGILPIHQYSMLEFEEVVSLNILVNQPEITEHFKNTVDDVEARDLILEQIYRWFSRWDGVPVPSTNGNYASHKKRNGIGKIDVEGLKLLSLKRGIDGWELRVISDKGKSIKTLLLDQNLFSRLREVFPVPDWNLECLLFELDTQYGDYVFTRKLHPGQQCAVIMGGKQRGRISATWGKFPDFQTSLVGSEYEICTFSLTLENVAYLPSRWTTGKPKSILLRNGIRVSRNQWMTGAGPELVRTGEIKHVWLDGKRIEFPPGQNSIDLSDQAVGIYAIIIPQSYTIYFSIAQPDFPLPAEVLAGWDTINSCPSDESATMIGVWLAALPTSIAQESQSVVRNWIDAVIDGKSKDQGGNLITKSLNRSKYGLSTK